MRLRRALALAGLVTLANVLVAVFGYARSPAWVTFGPGHSPGAALKVEALAALPTVSLMLVAGLALRGALSSSDREGRSGRLGLAVVSFAALLLVGEGALVAQAINPAFNASLWALLAAGVVLLLLARAQLR